MIFLCSVDRKMDLLLILFQVRVSDIKLQLATLEFRTDGDTRNRRIYVLTDKICTEIRTHVKERQDIR